MLLRGQHFLAHDNVAYNQFIVHILVWVPSVKPVSAISNSRSIMGSMLCVPYQRDGLFRETLMLN